MQLFFKKVWYQRYRRSDCNAALCTTACKAYIELTLVSARNNPFHAICKKSSRKQGHFYFLAAFI